MPPATTSQQAQQNLQQFGSSMKSPDMALQEAQAATGVNQAQQQVSGLRSAIQNSTNLLDRVAPSVMGRTQNSLVTSAQADRQIGNEQAPINAQLNKEQTDYANANQDYSTAEQRAEARANGVISGQQNQLSYLQSVYGNLKSAEDTAAQQAEARRQFDASQALSREQQSASLAASRASAPKLVGGAGNAGPSRASGSMSHNAAGGYAFTNAGGQPVTMAQYLASNGVGSASQIASTAVQLLGQGSASDRKIAAEISSGRYTPAQLAQKFPQVFGGSF